MADFLELREGESNQQYRERLYGLKFSGTHISWQIIADLIGRKTGEWKDESTWRREAHKYINKLLQAQEIVDGQVAEVKKAKQEVEDVLVEYQKERIKVSDINTQNRAYIRRLAREDSIKEIAAQAAKEIGSKKMLAEPNVFTVSESTNEAILTLSDWHFGIEVNNYWNTFNPEICKERVAKLRDEVIAFCNQYDIVQLHIVNLSDLIAGRIHSTIRFESRCDVITQTIEVSEILAEFISDIASNDGPSIHYYDCLDNHSRLEPIKSDSLDLESLVRIVPWYLKERFRNLSIPVMFHTNEFSDDIITFSVLNGKYTVAGVHGHKDKPGKVIDNLTMMTKHHYDLVLTAHLHHFSCDEKNETLVVSNGSLMGTDSYAKDLRLSSKASQNIILVTEKSVADYIHRIVLN